MRISLHYANCEGVACTLVLVIGHENYLGTFLTISDNKVCLIQRKILLPASFFVF